MIVGNEAAAGPGGGIYDLGSTTIVNSILVENKPGYISGQGWVGAGIYGTSSTMVINSIVQDNRGFEISGQPVVTYSNIAGNYPGEGNIDTDPLFRDPENDDFHLMAIECGDSLDSPCIDAGDPLIFDAVLDCWHGLGTNRSDMGAYSGNNSGWPTVIEQEEREVVPVPTDCVLLQNYPNPFNSQTAIKYNITQSGTMSLSVYNVLGQRVVTLFEGFRKAGEHSIVWNAAGFSSGMYFVRLEAGGYSRTIKLVLLR
jgi:hypothetical protein